MPKVLPAYLEQRRQQILDSAAACFARRGFHQTTMQHICAEADLSPGAVYRYFSSKDEIIHAMCLRNQAEDANTIQAIAGEQDTMTALDELVRIFLLGIEDRENCALMLELSAEAMRNEAIAVAVRESRHAIIGPMAAYVRGGQAAGDFNPALDADSVAQVMLAIYQGLVMQRIAEPELNVGGFAEAVKALFHGSFAAASPSGAGAALAD